MLRRTELKRTTPLRATGFRRTPTKLAGIERQAPPVRAAIRRRAAKKRPGHDQKYLAACRGQTCFLQMHGCASYPDDPTVVPAHQNEGKGTGLKVPDRFTVPACHHCHTLYDQSGLPREYKRAAWDWAYTRWSQVRDAKMRCL